MKLLRKLPHLLLIAAAIVALAVVHGVAGYYAISELTLSPGLVFAAVVLVVLKVGVLVVRHRVRALECRHGDLCMK
jgi:hypothetical protein